MEEMADVFELIDDAGEIVRLELIESFEHKGETFCAFCDPDVDPEKEDVEVRIMRVIPGDEEDGDEYEDIESESELDELFNVFMDIMEQENA